MIANTDFADPPDAADVEISKRLTSQIDIEFEDVHIIQILEFVSEYTNVNIVIDKNAVPPPLKAQGHKPLGKEGYQLTGQVPYIWLKDVSLKESLKALLLPLNLTYKVEPGRIYVTSAKNNNTR
jgi:type II secretory pathway component GspD/PulD (secretin)